MNGIYLEGLPRAGTWTPSQERATGRASSHAHPPVPNSSPTSALMEGSRRWRSIAWESENLACFLALLHTMFLLCSRHHASCLTLRLNFINVKRENSNSCHRFVVGLNGENACESILHIDKNQQLQIGWH